MASLGEFWLYSIFFVQWILHLAGFTWTQMSSTDELSDYYFIY